MTTFEPPRVSVQELAAQFGRSESGVYRAIVRGQFPIPTFRSGKRRYADPRIVRDYFAAKRSEGLAALEDSATEKTGEL
jgi:hypothetical protein